MGFLDKLFGGSRKQKDPIVEARERIRRMLDEGRHSISSGTLSDVAGRRLTDEELEVLANSFRGKWDVKVEKTGRGEGSYVNFKERS